MSCCRSRDGRTQWRNADRCRGSRLFEGDNPIIVDPTRGHRMPRKAASIFCSAASSIRPLTRISISISDALSGGGRDFSDDISDHSERRDSTVLIGGRRVTPLKEALAALADALAKRPAEEILFDWFRSGRPNSPSRSSVGIPTCKPRSIASTKSIWPSSAKGSVTRHRKTIDCGKAETARKHNSQQARPRHVAGRSFN